MELPNNKSANAQQLSVNGFYSTFANHGIPEIIC
jgi:hypothetical protein